MNRTFYSLVSWGALIAGAGCSSSVEESPPAEEVAKASQELSPAAVWNAATTTVGVLKNLYSGINWFNCQFAQTCPESEAHREATRIINQIESTIAAYDTDSKISDVNVLLDRAALDYAYPQLMSMAEEQDLVNDARDVYIHFRDRLNNTDASNQAQVNAAYALTPFFNVLAALVDNIAQNALANGRIPMDWAWINARRSDTAAVNYALIGAQSLQYNCGGSSVPTAVDTTQSRTNAFRTKKLWKKFAGNNFNRTFCDDTYTCNLANRVSGGSNANFCQRTGCSFFGLVCHACGVYPDDFVYIEELPNVLAAMNRDANVLVARAALAILARQGFSWFYDPYCGQSYGQLRSEFGEFSQRDFNEDPTDWDYGYYKGQCQPGYAQLGLSKDTGAGRPHAVLCQLPAPGSSDPGFSGIWYARPTLPGDVRRANRLGDWDYGYSKLECGSGEYVAGTSQDPSTHALRGIKCSPATDGSRSFSQGCYVRSFDSSGASRNVDWDPTYYKAECRPNEVMVGVSANPNGLSPHAILCCAQ
jgi:hypothetical protein